MDSFIQKLSFITHKSPSIILKNCVKSWNPQTKCEKEREKEKNEDDGKNFRLCLVLTEKIQFVIYLVFFFLLYNLFLLIFIGSITLNDTISFMVLFQLIFNFIYKTFNKKIYNYN